MIIEGYEVTEYNGFYTVKLGNKTYTRAKLSNLETIIHMYVKGGDTRQQVINNVPVVRTEWIATHSEETLATGKIVDVVTKAPVNPTKEEFVFDPYSYVPEYGKGAEAVRTRAEEAHEAEYGGKTFTDNLLSGLSNVKMPSFPSLKMPQIGLFGKGVGGVLVLFVLGVVALIAIGYSGLGGSAGRVAESEHKRKRG